MFARLREHAQLVDADLQTLESNLNSKMRPLYLLNRQNLSEGALSYLKRLEDELEGMRLKLEDMIEETKQINCEVNSQLMEADEQLSAITEEVHTIEDRLQPIGYVPFASKREDQQT